MFVYNCILSTILNNVKLWWEEKNFVEKEKLFKGIASILNLVVGVSPQSNLTDEEKEILSNLNLRFAVANSYSAEQVSLLIEDLEKAIEHMIKDRKCLIEEQQPRQRSQSLGNFKGPRLPINRTGSERTYYF